ncbi:hypothetical protein PC116_g9119 [Phytophthora cactorum]|uniref:Uncharacterized protein n=1 Tax=Phytophthora cactorum TaxID=29920 RepID=A0A8T1E4E8_9STRA|nr:hypothetical protein PC114_g12243 [Phytophthora cactorum]KAG2947854.1 hypothetical protein PC117_g6470 [Phytophthora cactorum]KAG3030039.1 hypothetical protein PC119_g6382 [Phytophthora cactorum]KAG3180621.1 hypothetical protein C6341_g6813 [Phytophthora cactorum]KAG4242984.1 hypothetical protein PC116_g9119 [Phytophthora cactorum]
MIHTGAARLGLEGSPQEVRVPPCRRLHEALEGCFVLDAKAEDYKDKVLDAGPRAEDVVIAFFMVRDLGEGSRYWLARDTSSSHV